MVIQFHVFRHRQDQTGRMVQVDLLWITAALLSSPLLTLCDPLFVVSAPQILRVGTTEKVFVEALNYKEEKPINVIIRVMNFPSNDKDLFSTTVTLKPEEKFQAFANVTINNINNIFHTDLQKKQYVYLTANFEGHYSMEKIVMVTFQSGYIFIQTDKTIYTPDSTVRYRVFPLNLEAKSRVSPFVVEIVTPEGIIIQRHPLYTISTFFKSMEFKLGSPISTGIWKIVGSFTDNPNKNFTTEFEVKEYVLPSFEVNLMPERPFFYTEDETFPVTINAKYLFGEAVQGTAFVVFGIFSEGKKTSLRSSLARVNIVNGQGKAVLKKDHIRQTFPNIDELVRKTLYISVSVLTESGSEMVEVERRGIHIVKAPYTIHFTRTPKYFKPGMPFDFMVYVTNPDETPAEGIDLLVNPPKKEKKTNNNGIAKFTINTLKEASILNFTVSTHTKGIPAEKTMTAHAYKPKDGSQNYLHIDVNAESLEVGKQVTFKLHVDKAGDHEFTYMVLSKGRIVDASRIQHTSSKVIAESLEVTKEMLPSFRLVVYYYAGDSEVVSDSIWMDVEDTCMGSLEVNVEESLYKPSDMTELKITGDPGAKVRLVAVDKGIYVLNNKNRLSQTKIWDTFEKHDLACTAGSGKDSMGVFYDAGLLFMSNSAGSTPDRRDFSCPTEAKRKRRDLTKAQLKKTLVEDYSDNLRHCCLDGMVENLLGYTCERRAEYVEDGEECRKAFLNCCKKLAEVKQEAVHEELHLARSEEEEYDENKSDNIVTRSVFPESWMWMDLDLPDCKEKQKCDNSTELRFPESITTWVITAISTSADYGICVAEPKEIVVKKSFFVDLKLPYSAVVNEQIEIKAVVHNLNRPAINKAIVELKETETICSFASYKKKYRTTVSIAGKSSRAVSFVIIPLVPGQYDIEVTVRDPDGGSDGVKKKLNVVTQGVLKSVGEQTVILEPSKHGGTQRSEFKRHFLVNQMPDTDAYTYIAIRGKPISQLVNEAISGKSLDSLIKEPHGCAEQNLIRMALPLLSTHYLDKTNQWEEIGVDKRTEALGHISTGYTTELKYRKADGSFASFNANPGSTWLTAYAVKMFSKASNLVKIDPDVICNAIRWLILKTQMPDGVFIEMGRSPSSAVRSKSTQIPMTAFVLIALQEGSLICTEKVSSLQQSMDKAASYILNNIASESNPYAVAIASYALANAGKQNHDVLFKFVSAERTHWTVTGSHSYTLEATGYALLALLKTKNFEEAAPVVKWLKSNQEYSNNYHSTQATALIVEAITKYMTEMPPPPTTGGMIVTVSSTARKSSFKGTFTKATRGLQRSARFQANGDLTVVATGEGEGSISVITLYYAKPDENSTSCKNFDLDVKFIRNRTISFDGALATYTLSIETKFLNDTNEAAMTILDIGLLTGFVPDTSDLKKLMGTDRYIQDFEVNTQLSERGSLIIYLNKVSNVVKERIVFRMHKMLEVALPQPAGIAVYEYYAKENRCVKFYDVAERTSGKLHTLCPTEVCSCAEANCPQLKGPSVPEENERTNEACRKKDFAYKATLKEVKLSRSTIIYVFTIVEVLLAGSDPVHPKRQINFLAHSQCKGKLDLKVGKDYLIMGPEPKKVAGSYRYVLVSQTWIEYWPTSREGQENKNDNRERYKGLAGLSHLLDTFGCST
ncbi:complement C3-like [Colossoma macropomum]|uniref:complement C3-like n=1 Tax=Colossoma macropomum TaxID=42526 RepID=UPI00186461F9|nr:complement C3-like [Colossoma macropomum]